jgi:site-specific DNA recombinase
MNLLDRFNIQPEEQLFHETVKQHAYAYLRVSHEDSAERGTSIETQRRDIELFAERNNIEIVQWFIDAGKSAYNSPEKRTEFQRMIVSAKADPRISVVLVWKSDRFSRGKYEPSAIKHELSKYGVRVISVLDNYDPATRAGIALEKMNEAMDHIRSLELGETIHRHLTTNAYGRDAETGWAYKNGGRPLFGYRNHRIYIDQHRKYQRQSHCIWLLDDDTASGKPIHQWARTMLIDWRMGEGLGYDRIAQRLTEMGVPTAMNKPGWNHGTIVALLTWDKLLLYAGYGIWNRLDRREDKKLLRNPSEWIVIEKAHPAIITLEEAEAIESMRPKKIHSTPKKADTRWLLSGLISCGHCNTSYVSKVSRGVDYYICGSHLYRCGAGCVAAWMINRGELETAVLTAVCKQLPSDKKTIERMVAKLNKRLVSEWKEWEETKPDRERTLLEIEEKIQRLTDAIARGVSSEAIELEINTLVGQKKRLEAAGLIKPKSVLSVDEFLSAAKEAAAAKESDDIEQRRQVIHQHISKIIVDPEKHEIEVFFRDSVDDPCSDLARGNVPPMRSLRSSQKSVIIRAYKRKLILVNKAT